MTKKLNGKIKNPLKQKEMEEDDAMFVSVREIVKKPKRFRGLVYGSRSTGKTHFGMTCSPPVIVLDSEDRADIIAPKFSDEDGYLKDIRIAKWSTLKQLEKRVNSAIRILEKHYQDTCEYDEEDNLIKDGEIGTIVIDKISDAWEAAILEYIHEKYGEDTSRAEIKLDPRSEYGIINEMHNSIRDKILKECRFNCCFIAGAKNTYSKENQFQVDGVKADGQKKNEEVCDIVLFMYNINGIPHCDIKKNSLGIATTANEIPKMTYKKLQIALEKIRKKSNIRTAEDIEKEDKKRIEQDKKLEKESEENSETEEIDEESDVEELENDSEEPDKEEESTEDSEPEIKEESTEDGTTEEEPETEEDSEDDEFNFSF